jgi:hypothetical protein
MSEHLDELARALASGVSRRSALKRFFGAVFGLGAASALPRRANAVDAGQGGECVEICRCAEGAGALAGLPFGLCVAICTVLGPGSIGLSGCSGVP